MDVMDREGGDITAADMIDAPEEPSEITQFFAGSKVFLTGGTGFLGKIFLEKLLRTCHRLEHIYVMVRPKKGKDVQKRYEEIFEGPNFDNLYRKRPDFQTKVSLVIGDISEPDLGLSEADQEILKAEVDCIIHCAATVRFDEKLRQAGLINVRSTKDLLKIAKQMKKLRALLYVSTAFSNCTRKEIDEKFYDPPIAGEKLLGLLDLLDDNQLDQITPVLLEQYPNTYVFTKALAEDIVKKEGKTLPIAIIRPSIVIASVKEPVAGWIDNLYGATGVMVGAATGVLRSLHGKKENTAEMVPADYVINCALAAAWDVALVKSMNDNQELDDRTDETEIEKEIPIYNFVNTQDSKITWDEFMSYTEKHAKQVPSKMVIWHYFFAVRANHIAHLLAVFFYQTIPAYIVDFGAVILGKKPMMVKGYQKITKFSKVISYFSCREWTFTNQNVQKLWQRMNNHDRRLFEFSMSNFNWDAYFYTYVRGSRVYLLKDPLETIPEGAVKYYKMMAAHYVLLAVLGFLLYKLVAIMLGMLLF